MSSIIGLEATGGDSIQIYTDWANRYLAKSTVPLRQIRDISNDFRDYRVVSQLINVIVPANDYTPSFHQRIAKTTSNLDGLATCLEYLKIIGLDCAKLTKTDIDSGNLGAVLQLLYLLSTYKQKLRQIKKDLKLNAMPPAVTKLPSPKSRITAPKPAENLNSNFLAPSSAIMSTSRLQTPSRISRPAEKSSTTKLTPSSTTSSTTSLKSSGIRPPSASSTTSSRASGNNNTVRVGSSSIAKPSKIRVATNSPANRVVAVPTPPEKLAAVKSIKNPTTSSSVVKQEQTPTMLKLKLFNAPKKSSTPSSAPIGGNGATENKITPPVRSSGTGIKAPSANGSKLIKPTSKIAYRKEEKIEVDSVKRCSKSSEEESGYVGFSSTGSSPASTSSTEGSLSMHSASSKSSTSSHSPSSDDLTLNASIITTVAKNETRPVLAVIGIKSEKASVSEENKEEGAKRPAIGVVSPMMTHKKLLAKNESSPDVSEKSEVAVPKMAPIRQPPSYEQLLEQGKITSPTKSCASPLFGEPSTSTAEQNVAQPSASRSSNQKKSSRDSTMSLERREKNKAKSSESSGYNTSSEGGIAMFAKMREKLKEYDDMTKKAQQGYPESFEDSSSLSSGISDNIEFDDVSTDDLSGIEMATVASKHSDYGHFVRSSSSATSSKPLRAPSEARSRKIAEQENIHKLLSQCRTSQRGSSFGQHSIRSPGYATYSPVAATHHRPPAKSDYHSLDRKTHLAEFSTSGDNRIAALLSPRRCPNPPPVSHHHHHHHQMTSSSAAAALNASGMSRSMILLETLSATNASSSPRQSRRHQHVIDVATSSQHPRRSHSPRAPSACSTSARLPLSIASPINKARPRNASSATGIYGTYHSDAFQLYRLADDQIQYSSSGMGSRSEMGSQLSLASTTAYATLNEKYEHAIQNMTRDLESYKSTIDSLTKKQDNYTVLFELFEQKLKKLTHHIEKSNLKSEEAARFRQDIAHLREISTHLASAAQMKSHNDGAGELLRQPSLESIRSSMSSSSKSSKHEKMSLNSFGKSKKSWIRSSLSKLTKKKNSKEHGEQMPSISGSSQTLDNVDVIELRQELRERDSALTEVRLDALDRARQVDVLRETVNKLKHENKQLKKEMDRLTSCGATTRTSSRASEEPLYDVAAGATSSGGSARSSNGATSIKVTVNVDLAGEISSAVCPDNEIIVGYLAGSVSGTWSDVDRHVLDLFAAYVGKIDPENHLDISDAILGYQIGKIKRIIDDTTTLPTNTQPADILHPSTTIRMFMRGAAQSRVDSLVLDTLLPTQMLTQLVKYIETERRLVLAGAAGIGKSKLARSLAAYIAMKLAANAEDIVDLKIPEDNSELLKTERILETILKSKKTSIVIIDNIPKNRIAFVASVFAANSLATPGPIVICTVNRYQIPEMQISQNQNFKMFLLTMRMEGVSGFMLRFLRRRVVEAEYRQLRQMSMEMMEIIAFLPIALQAVNQFIEKTNSIDVTIGPRVFLQCPLSVDESRHWFIKLWNDNFIPYMERVAREGKKTFGRCSNLDDPTDQICEKWPWLEGAAPEDSLRRLALHDLQNPASTSGAKQHFNPLESLIQLHATKHPPL